MLSENHTKCIEFYSDYSIKSTFVLYIKLWRTKVDLILIIGNLKINVCLMIYTAHISIYLHTQTHSYIHISI